MISSCVLLSSFALARLLPPAAIHTDISICVFRTVVGKPCPLCGLTRAFVHAAHGQFDPACQDHPFWYVVATIILVLGVMLAVDAVAGTDSWGRLARAVRPWWPAIILIVAVFGVVRLLTG